MNAGVQRKRKSGVAKWGYALALCVVAVATPGLASAQASPPSLYTRLGGYDAIAAVVQDVTARLAADPQLGRFWSNRGSDGVTREHQLLIDFIADKAGGPVHYPGRKLELSHKGMRISESDWQLFMMYLNETLTKFQVAPQERADVVAFMESTKGTMVGK